MKKIFNRVLATAMAVPMVLSQGIVGTVSAEDAGTKSLKIDTFTYIAPDKTESDWNQKLLNVVLNLDGTQKEIAKDKFLAMIPQTNSYGVMLAEVMANASNPVATVNGGIVTIKGTVDLSAYAEDKIYSKVREAAGMDLTMTAFNKTIEYSVTVDGNVLENGKEIQGLPVVTIDGENINQTNASEYFKGLAADLAAEVSAQVGVTAEIADAMDVELISKMQRAEYYAGRAAVLERAGSYSTADEMMAVAEAFVEKRTEVYDFPSTIDEVVARHGNGFNTAIDVINSMTTASGYAFDITAGDVAAIAKEGYAFEAAASNGTYTLTFSIPDAEAAEVEAYVNKNAVPDENGVTMVYKSSKKNVEVKATVNGNVYYNVTREIELQDSSLTTTSTTPTTTTTTDTSSTTTTTTTGSGEGSSTTTTTTTTGSGSTTESTTTTTETTPSGTGTTETTLPEEFEIASVEVEAGVGYYFSHDENAFDLSELISSLTLVGTLDGEAYTVAIAASDYATYLTPAYATPADFFASVEGTAYVANELKLTFTAPETLKIAEGADLSVTGPTVYIGVKGDADLNGVVNISDAQKVLTYYAESAAGVAVTPMNEDAALSVLAYFLADTDTESTAGENTDEATLTIADAQSILTFYAQGAASLTPSWDEILGK